MKIENFTYFYPENPTLTTVDSELFKMTDNSSLWVAEKKYNGSRLQLHKINDSFQFWNRHKDILKYSPDVNMQNALLKLKNKLPKGYCLFDGELRHNKTIGVRQKVILFDVFIYDNELLTHLPFAKRRAILEKLADIEEEPIGIIKQHSSGFTDLYNSVINDNEYEGLVVKNLNGMLQLGRKSNTNSKWMLKVRKTTGRHRF